MCICISCMRFFYEQKYSDIAFCIINNYAAYVQCVENTMN